MKIELKSLKVHDDMSDETTCYSATVYVDGKRAFTASNNGRGAPDDYHPINHDDTLLNKAIEYAKSLPPVESEWGKYNMDLEYLVMGLIEKKQINAWLKRKCKTKIVLLDPSGEYSTINQKFHIGLIPALKRKYPADEIINLRFE